MTRLHAANACSPHSRDLGLDEYDVLDQLVQVAMENVNPGLAARIPPAFDRALNLGGKLQQQPIAPLACLRMNSERQANLIRSERK